MHSFDGTNTSEVSVIELVNPHSDWFQFFRSWVFFWIFKSALITDKTGPKSKIIHLFHWRNLRSVNNVTWNCQDLGHVTFWLSTSSAPDNFQATGTCFPVLTPVWLSSGLFLRLTCSGPTLTKVLEWVGVGPLSGMQDGLPVDPDWLQTSVSFL
jgi:hypothetical protein